MWISRSADVRIVLLAMASAGCFVTKPQHDALVAKSDELAKQVDAQKQEIKALHDDLEATRERLDNALRVNADNGSDLMSEKARINALVGKLDEQAHTTEELKKEVAAARGELDARLDEMKRAQEAQQPKAPPVTIPADKSSHFAAIEQAYAQRDWSLVRTLGREYQSRYATDEKVDDVSYLLGDADMKDNRPSSALGEFNKVLKATPPSNVLDKTLLGMGDAYMLLHDCQNAKLAYQACASRFAKQKTGQDAKAHVAALEHPAAGTCMPQ